MAFVARSALKGIYYSVSHICNDLTQEKINVFILIYHLPFGLIFSFLLIFFENFTVPVTFFLSPPL